MHLNKLKLEFEKLVNLPKHVRMLEVCSLLTEYYHETGIKPVVVDGLSVEIYTRNNYSTYDIDIITDGRDKISQQLTEELGFTQKGRSWYNPELEISIEIPGNHLEGSYDRVMNVQLESGRNIFGR